jgi:hypothetical protein
LNNLDESGDIIPEVERSIGNTAISASKIQKALTWSKVATRNTYVCVYVSEEEVSA